MVDGSTGKVLYARSANSERYPASLTKMMTLYLLFEAIQDGKVTLDTKLSVSKHAANQEPTKLGLKSGDTIPVEIALKALVVRSANDVAVTVAEALGGTESGFAAKMTRKAQELGMTHTRFRNASGLPNPLQITTARDMATLGRRLAYDFPAFFRYFSMPSFAWRGRVYETHNNLIGRVDGTDGIKTGYTRASGFNLVSSVVRDGKHVIGVVMGGKSARTRDAEMARLVEQTYDRIDKSPTLVAEISVPWRALAEVVKPNPMKANALVAALSASVPARKPEIAPKRSPAFIPDTQIAAADIVVTPRTVLASYQPDAPQPTASLEEGDIGGTVRFQTPSPAEATGLKRWAVQIGAFEDERAALAQLAVHAERSMDVLGRAKRVVASFQSVDRRMLYRARFGPFSENEAREVCRRMTERGQTCFAVVTAP